MSEQSSKELVRALFQMKELPRLPFMPWVCSFAAQLEQIEVRDMLSDASLLSNSLVNAQQLYGYDAIANIFDPALEAEVCGCDIDWGGAGALPKVISHPMGAGATVNDLNLSDFEKRGRIPEVLEATRRLVLIKGKQVAIAGVVTGPVTLGRHLKGDGFIADFNKGSEEAGTIIAFAAGVALRLARKYCELGVDLIVVADEALGLVDPVRVPSLSAPLRSIWNVTRYFGAGSLIMARGCSNEHIRPIVELRSDGVTLSGAIESARLRQAALEHKRCYSWNLALSMTSADLSALQHEMAYWRKEKTRSLFLSTEWEVPCATNVDQVHEAMDALYHDIRIQ